MASTDTCADRSDGPHRRHARPLFETGAAVRPRQRVLLGRLRGASRGGLSAAGRSDRARRRRLVARRRRAAAAAARLSRRADRPGDQHAPLLDRYCRGSLARRRPVAVVAARSGGGRSGVRRRPRRERQRHPRPAVDDEGPARRRRLPLHRTEVIWQPVAGLDVPRHSRDGHRRTRPARRSCTRSCRATPKAIGSSRPGTCWECGRRAATTRSSTASSCPIATWSGWCRQVRPESTRSCSPSSPGRSSDSGTSTTASRGERSM